MKRKKEDFRTTSDMTVYTRRVVAIGLVVLVVIVLIIIVSIAR